jgi:hypothetical protein
VVQFLIRMESRSDFCDTVEYRSVHGSIPSRGSPHWLTLAAQDLQPRAGNPLAGRRIDVEMWLYPDGSPIFEISTKCVPKEGF